MAGKRMTAAQLANLRPAKKGEPSRNPSGKSKFVLSAEETARKHAVKMVETLVAIALDIKAPPAARATAATQVLDRGLGKPTQPIDAKVSIYDKMSIDERVAFDTILTAAIAAAGEVAGDPGGQPPTHH